MSLGSQFRATLRGGLSTVSNVAYDIITLHEERKRELSQFDFVVVVLFLRECLRQPTLASNLLGNQGDLELLIFRPEPTECRDYRYGSHTGFVLC